MLTLFDDVFSPYARKVRIALYEKGVPFERVRALHGDCFGDWFAEEMRAGRAFFPLERSRP